MEYRARINAGLPGTIGIWEDVSGTGGFGRLDEDGRRIYTTVKLTQVTRYARMGGGPIIYDSEVEFYIEDPTYRHF